VEAPEVALVPEGDPGAGGTILLLQRWVHDAAAWEALPVARQERAMGRTKPDSVELEDRAPDSHVARTDQELFGDIFRRNLPYGTATDHGTMFVGLSAEQRRLAAMLESMAGQERTDPRRDAGGRWWCRAPVGSGGRPAHRALRARSSARHPRRAGALSASAARSARSARRWRAWSLSTLAASSWLRLGHS